ncbi:exocyst complex component Sec5-domain-containing protein [Thamnocephalis sphaerospora]|uniref:Exocyst complex component SEC5 n=1 Tax=Thamnocephalis sphaerospora TaxID=78915 RepID=A0A4P9XQJ0_9FUNG|nr:exocyst complex component Sec5-domain-containing protein [Thamnocephalis sphaerospora]|eukprot:RKP07761.1 exocyst complex component Sec5-domain-containing protein [Thamnocephalis sphaerospora]
MEAPLPPTPSRIDDADVLRHYQLDEFRGDEWVEVETEKLSSQAATAAAEERDADPLGIKRSIFEPDRRKSRQSRRSLQLTESEKETICRVAFKTFDAKTFLRDVHRDTAYGELCHGAEHLRRQLEKRSEGMRDLVRQHFDHFVNAKNAIDDVHYAMDNNGLTPDTDYGVAGFQERARVALDYTETLFGPILERRGRTEKLRAAQAIVDKHKFFFGLPSSLTEHAKQKKYDLAVRDYKKGKHLMRTLIGKPEKRDKRESSDDEIASVPEGQRRLFGRIWAAAEQVVTGIRGELMKQLEEAWRPVEQQERNIRYLLDLDSGEDPGWYYLQAMHKWGLDLLREAFEKFSERMNGNVHSADLQKERQAAALPGSQRGIGAAILRAPFLRKALDSREKQYGDLFSKERDSTAWEAILAVITALCDVLTRCLPTFWRAAKKYVDGKYSNMPAYDKKEARKSIALRLKRAAGHLKKADECQRMSAEMSMRYMQLVARVFSIQDTPSTSVPPMPTSGPPSSKSKTADLPVFTPPSHTAITGHYLIRCVERIVQCRRDLNVAGKGKDTGDDASGEAVSTVRALERKVREKCVKLLCDVWINDAKAFYIHEDWQPHPKHPEVTMQIRLIYRLHKRTILRLVALLGVETVREVNWENDAEMPVSARALDAACNAFLRSIFAWLDCLNHLASDAKLYNDRRIVGVCTKRNLTAEIRDFRTLVSGANLYRFHKIKLPKLARMTERLLVTSLGEEIDLLVNFSSRLRDRMVDQYVSRKAGPVLRELQTGLLMDGYEWTSPHPLEDLRPFVRRFLLSVVLVHAEVHALAPVLERRTLTALQDYIAQSWLAAHSELDRVGLGGFVQSMFEMYFVQKTLSVYCSDLADDHYRQTQAALERAFRRFTSPEQTPEASGLEVTGDPADRKLLRPAMEKMQERLTACRRASAAEFACFRTPGSRASHTISVSKQPGGANMSRNGGGSSERDSSSSSHSSSPLPMRPPRPSRNSSGGRSHAPPPPRSSHRPSPATAHARS